MVTRFSKTWGWIEGAFHNAYVLTTSGVVINPFSVRNGVKTWLLEPGRYVVVSARVRGTSTTVIVQCVEFGGDSVSVLSERVLNVVDFDEARLVRWARVSCPGELE
jgi:hypothetical protein